MRYDLGQLRVDKLIVHELPRHLASEAVSQPILSDIESPLTVEVKNFFREKITGTLGTEAYDVEFDPDTTSPVPNLVSDNLGNSATDFVVMSQEVARHLHQCQGGINPEGLLTVVQVRVENRRGLCILKLEKQEGARVRQETSHGKTTFSVQHIRDLMLTGKTKVFKVGLFVREGDGTIDGAVCDRQKGYGGTVAYFFLSRFLGCRLKELPEITTKRFLEATESFINEEVADPERKASYQVALLAELNATRDSVSPEAFANNNLATEHRQAFMTHLEEAGLTAPSFVKDTNLVKPHLRRIQFTFQTGISVLTSPDNIGEQVKVQPEEDGRTRIEITDFLKNMHGRQ
jgi:hypothetical protein